MKEIKTIKRKHITDGSICWCKPKTKWDYTKLGGGKVIVHNEPN